MKSANTVEMKMLEAILVATQNGTLIWKQPGPGEYHGAGPVEVVIREICPLIAGDPETAGVQAFELDAGGVGPMFWSGTAGCEKIREILAAGLPSWGEHFRSINKKMSDVIEKLEKRSDKTRNRKK
jgi:hypothetical protein